MLTENKFSKYLIYAIGEIILVVIGILIALSINNWNENQKLKKEELKLLNNLEIEIESNLSSVNSTLKHIDTIQKMAGRLLKKGLENRTINLNPLEVIESLGYNTNKYETSIINEILGSNSRALISSEKIMKQIRTLKQAYDQSDQTQFYADEFWNGKVTDFILNSGLGIYLGNADQKYDIDYKATKTYYSLLGIMNGYQLSLLISRQDLRQALDETRHLLKEQKE